MKKIIACLWSLALLGILAACAQDTAPASQPAQGTRSAEVFAQASAGEIPELELKLGDTQAKFEEVFGSDDEEEEEDFLEEHYTGTVYEGEETVTMRSGKANYYYETEWEDQGISRIFSFTDSYGFSIGMAGYIEDIITAMGEDYQRLTNVPVASLYDTECDILVYQPDQNHQLNFYFVDDNLAAVELLDTRYWTAPIQEETAASSNTSAADASEDEDE